MLFNRRSTLALVPGLVAWSAAAQEQVLPAIATYESATGGRIGLYAENTKTGAKIAWRADERFVMCSTFKASLAACVLARIDRGEDHLDQMISFTSHDLFDYAPVARQNLAKGTMSVAEMCKAAVELSDNTCANQLLARIGGPATLTAFWRATGDAVTRLDHYELELNRSPPGDPHDTTTPAAMAGNLRRIMLGEVLSAESRERLTGWMLDCKTGDNRLRGGLPREWKIGDKTGNNGKDASGDIAVVWPQTNTPLLICTYTQGGTPTPAQLETVFAAIGRFAGERLISSGGPR